RVTFCHSGQSDIQNIQSDTGAVQSDIENASRVAQCHTINNQVNHQLEPEEDVAAKRADPIPLQKAFKNYNTVASELGLPLARSLTPDRARKLRARLSEHGGLDAWNRALLNLETSPFCRGENPRGWRADLDFLL